MSLPSLLRGLAALALFASPLFADTPAEGFALSARPYPGQGLVRTLSNGELLVFDGTELAVHDASGSFLRSVTTVPGFVFGSFLLVDSSESFAVLGESSNGDIFRVDLASGMRTTLTNLSFNYDAAFEDSDHILVSAAASGAGNDVYRVDTRTGQTTLLVLVFGASGPLAVDAAGNLYLGLIASAFPPPPGSSDILRFEAAQLTGAPVLMEPDGTVFSGGFDGAAAMEFDPASGELYLAVNNFGTGSNRVRRVGTSAAKSPIIVDGTTGLTMGGLEFASQKGAAVFRGFQPNTGGALRYTSTDFFSVFARNEQVTRRPRATTSGPGTSGVGPFDVQVVDGPPGGLGFIFYGPLAGWSMNEVPVVLPQANAPLFFGLSPVGLVIESAPLVLDATGAGSVSYFNSSGATGFAASQVLMLSSLGGWAGTSDTAFL